MALTGGKNLFDDYSQPKKVKKAKKVGYHQAATEMATTEQILSDVPPAPMQQSQPATLEARMPFETAYYALCDRIHASGDPALLKELEKIVEDYGH